MFRIKIALIMIIMFWGVGLIFRTCLLAG